MRVYEDTHASVKENLGTRDTWKRARFSKHIEWEDQAFKHGNGKSARETSSTQLLLLFYSSYYSEGCCAFLSVCILFFILLISVYFELYWWCEDIYDVVVLLISFLLLVSHNFRWHFLQKKKKREEFWGHKQTQIIIYYLPVRLSRPIQNCNTYKHSKNKRSTWPFTLFKIFK